MYIKNRHSQLRFIVIGWSYRDSNGNMQYNMNLKKTDCKAFTQGDQFVIISQGN